MTSTSGRRRTPSGEVRGAVITAAIELLETVGPGGLTVRAVARAAGVAPMGVYNHFGDKDGLLAAIKQVGFVRLAETLQSDEDDPLARCRAVGVSYRALALEHPAVYRLMFTHPEEPSDVAMAAFERFIDFIRYGQERGAFISGDPHDLAKAIWAAVHGAVMLEIDAQGPPTTPADNDRHYTVLLDMIQFGTVRRLPATDERPPNDG